MKYKNRLGLMYVLLWANVVNGLAQKFPAIAVQEVKERTFKGTIGEKYPITMYLKYEDYLIGSCWDGLTFEIGDAPPPNLYVAEVKQWSDRKKWLVTIDLEKCRIKVDSVGM